MKNLYFRCKRFHFCHFFLHSFSQVLSEWGGAPTLFARQILFPCSDTISKARFFARFFEVLVKRSSNIPDYQTAVKRFRPEFLVPPLLFLKTGDGVHKRINSERRDMGKGAGKFEASPLWDNRSTTYRYDRIQKGF